MEIYLVGGAVRDKLLNYPSDENDWVVVGASVDDMLNAGFTQVGKDFPVFLHPDSKEEYALARTERKTGRGYTGFSFATSPDVTLEEDLQRRDLTINAMAMAEDGTLVDPYQGKMDLENRVLRHVSPAFCEDPVRILRVARFAARYHHLGFHVAEETQQLMQAMVDNGEVNHLVPERIWKEFSRALSERRPSVFVTVLRDCGALKVILPELNRLFGVPQSPESHPEIDTGVHTLMVLDQACALSPSPVIRFAALMHDLGKGTTSHQQWPKHPQHEQRGHELIKAMCQRLAVPNEFRDLADLASLYHTDCHRALSLTAGEILQLFKNLDAFRREQRFYDFLTVCEADSRGRTGFEKHHYPQSDYLAQALTETKKVEPGELVKEGYQGAQLGTELDSRRIDRIAAFKKRQAI